MITELPSEKAVKDLLSDLLGRPTSTEVDEPTWVADAASVYTADFVDDRGDVQACVAIDVPFAAFAGAAVALLPAGGAEDMVADGRPSPAVLDNVYEVLNILTSVLNIPGNPHIRIGDWHTSGEVPPHLTPLVTRPSRRMDVRVTVTGYGTGRLALVVA